MKYKIGTEIMVAPLPKWDRRPSGSIDTVYAYDKNLYVVGAWAYEETEIVPIEIWNSPLYKALHESSEDS